MVDKIKKICKSYGHNSKLIPSILDCAIVFLMEVQKEVEKELEAEAEKELKEEN